MARPALPCLPIALNSGLFWPRRSFLRYPGTIVAEILDPIPPGLTRQTFAARLQQDIETATARLIAEGERELARNGIKQRAGHAHVRMTLPRSCVSCTPLSRSASRCSSVSR